MLADGKFVTASEAGTRTCSGASRRGGNFGVVTSFVFQAHPVSIVYGGTIIWEMKTRPRSCAGTRLHRRRAGRRVACFPRTADGAFRRPFPREHWGKKCRPRGFPQRLRRGRRKGGERHPIRFAAANHGLADPTPYPRCRRCSTGSCRRGCSGTGRRLRQDIAGSGDRRPYRDAAKMKSDLSGMHLYPIDGACIGRGSTRPRRIAATRPGRWSSSASIQSLRTPRRSRSGRGTTEGRPSVQSRRACRIS